MGQKVGGTQTLYLIDDNNPTGYTQVMEEKATSTATPSVTYSSATMFQGNRRQRPVYNCRVFSE